ncbi:MAG: tetratricopeptide repeat protein, partial [bacterium]|nr:tetratricopeptide repeat protein [bacterium]
MRPFLLTFLPFVITLNAYAWDYTDRTVSAKSDDGSALASAWYELSYGGDYDTALSALERGPGDEFELTLQAYGRLNFLTGDSDTALEYYLRALQLYPQSPLAEIYMYKALILLEDTNGYPEMVSTLEGLLDNQETPPYLLGRIAVYLNDLYRLRGDYEKANAMLDRYNPITDWQIIGPFDNEGKHGLDAVYGPENGVNLNGVYEGKEYEVSWRRLPYPSPNGFYELTPVMRPNKFGTVYLATSVKSPERRDVFLMAGASGASKVWLNGELVLEENEYNTGLYDTYAIPVTLEAGDNLLLVKLCGDDGAWEIGQRLVALDGDPITDVFFNAGLEAINRAGLTDPAPAHDTYADFSARSYFDELIADGSADPYVLSYAAIYHYLYRDYDETAEIPKRIMNLGRSADPENLE